MERPDAITVEIGRLNLAVREILGDLSVMTSSTEGPDDVLYRMRRASDGSIVHLDASSSHLPDTDAKALMTLCSTIVAGINVVGTVTVRVRIDEGRPVFVAIGAVE